MCDAANGFVLSAPYCLCEEGRFFDGADCLLCNQTLGACEACLSENLCLQCVENFTLIEG